MVKFYSSTFSYDYSFPAVTLAYFLRYPNPYSTHVLSTDVISREFDPLTQRLHTVRLHLKRSKLPSAILKILPRSFLGASAAGDSQSYILERSTVDVREGWMETESRNLEWTGVLSVVEKQAFRQPQMGPLIPFDDTQLEKAMPDEKTNVTTTVTLHSRLGQNRWKRKQKNTDGTSSTQEEEQPPRMGFFKSWSTASLQRSIELIGFKRAERSQPNAKEGMKVVLERLREGGLVGVLEGMRRDRETTGRHGPFKRSLGPGMEGGSTKLDGHFDD